MSRPRVTVGIPFRDEAPYIEAAIRSILAQTARDFELLLVDDGSTDRSLEIAREVEDPRIRIFSDGERRGLAARLNEIARRARAELVARMDADDVSHPERLARQLALMESDPSCDACGTAAALVDEEERPFAVVEAPEPPVSPADALTKGALIHATMLAKRTWLLDHPYDETLRRAEDRDLWCRTAKDARLRALHEVLYVARVRARDRGFADDYVVAQRENRRLFLRYGPRALGLAGTAKAWASALMKSAVMRGAARASLAPALVRRRGATITGEAEGMAREALAASRAPSGVDRPAGAQRA